MNIEQCEMQKVPLNLPGLYLPKVRRDLTFRVTSGAGIFGGASKVPDKIIELYKVSGGFVYVPRHYKVDSSRCRVEDRTSAGGKTKFNFLLKLFDSQKRNQVEAVDTMVKSTGGILAAATGKGKTAMAVAAIQKIGRQALIVVPTEVLLEQWIERICGSPLIPACTDLKRSDIGIIQGPRADSGKPLTIATVQTLSQKDYSKAYLDQFGILVCDEVHRMGAPEWGKACSKVASRIRWGLSATPKRKDGLDDVFLLNIGPIVYTMLELDDHIIPSVVRLLTGTNMADGAVENPWNGKLNFSKMYKVLSNDVRRNELLASEIFKAYQKGRKILALSKRLEHMEKIRALLLLRGVKTEDIGILNAKTKDREKVLRDSRIVIGIEQIAGTGLDQPDLDTLFWLLPMQDIPQQIGRILRDYPDKREPLAIDPVDKFRVLNRMASNRLKQYNDAKYRVTTLDRRDFKI